MERAGSKPVKAEVRRIIGGGLTAVLEDSQS
jgi:hypothetical protein